MGRMILGCAAQNPEKFSIAGAVEYSEHPELGKTLDQLVPGAPASVTLAAAPPAEVPAGTVAIHFSLPAGTLAHLDWHRRTKTPAVIGTTGFESSEREQIDALAGEIPVMLTPNTSTGVNVLFWLAEQAARLLDPSYNIEIVEMHHGMKKDAPSGTARRLAESVMGPRGLDYGTQARHGREGIVGERPEDEIGIHTLRGGDVAGDHTVIFAGPGERIELTHRASSREVFAQGALCAAAWIAGRAPGAYSMNDVLGL